MPPEFCARWQNRFGTEQTRRLAFAMTAIAPLDLRTNLTHTSRETLLETLAAAGTEPEQTPLSPAGIRLRRKRNLKRIEGLDERDYVIQDEGSQLVSLALAPREGSQVLDACAGAGGKTLHLAELVGEKGALWAHDIDAARMESLEKRRAKANAQNIRMLEPANAAIHEPYDAVLIDAPCLGLGRLRREPTLAWRGPLKERLEEATALQRECLHLYSPLVRPGGILVYAVCSIEPEETTEMMEQFLNEHPEFIPDRLPELFMNEQLQAMQDDAGSQQTLLPSVHGTDGFFMARLRRRD